jgi:3-methyladenine DNA glycosylase AlkD
MSIRSELRSLKDPAKARILSGFFKTGPGQYGEGDRFLGIKVPDIRKVVGRHRQASENEVERLLCSPYHEERLAGLLLLVHQFQQGSESRRSRIFQFYLDHSAYINNWDLVDLSAPHIVGGYLYRGDRSLLVRLARSQSLWERRIAVIATFYFIRQGEDRETYKLAKLLLQDTHDLIHKAVGWMLREAGKRCSMERQCRFLDRYAARMPRTMLRYAIERLPEELRLQYMKQ